MPRTGDSVAQEDWINRILLALHDVDDNVTVDLSAIAETLGASKYPKDWSEPRKAAEVRQMVRGWKAGLGRQQERG